MLPLHAALLYGAPSHVTIKILRAYPNAARETDLQGRLPIHIAASMAAIVSVDDEFKCVLNELVRVWPESLWVPDDRGRTAMELVDILQRMMQDENDDEEEDDKENKKKQCHDEQQQHEYQQELERHTSKRAEKRMQQQDEYKSIYDMLSQGIAPTSTIPPFQPAVSTESDYPSIKESISKVCSIRTEKRSDDQGSVNKEKLSTEWEYPSIKETMSKVFSIKNERDKRDSDDQSSVGRDKSLVEITINAKMSQQEEDLALSSEHNTKDLAISSDYEKALHRIDEDRSYDDIFHGLSCSIDKENGTVIQTANHLSPCSQDTSIFGSIADSRTVTKEERKKNTTKRPLSNLVIKRRSKRKKIRALDEEVLSPFTQDTSVFSNLGSFDIDDDQVLSPCSQDTSIFSNLGIKRRRKRQKKGNGSRTIESSISSFESIGVSSLKEERKSPVSRQCSCRKCRSSAEINKEMDIIRRELHAFDTMMPTLLMDYLVASHWDNVMSRIRDAPSEVKAWAQKKVNDKVVLDVLPLHAAIVLGAPSDVIIALLNAYPSGAGEIDGNRSFPIHLAASCLTSMKRGHIIVDHLLNAFRSGKQAVDANGRTPSDIASIISTSLDHRKDDTRIEAKYSVSNESFSSNVTLKNTFEEDAAFAHLVEKAMTNLNISLKYQYSFLRQASARGIETIDDLLMADDDFLDTLFSEKKLIAELRRLLSLFIEGRG